MPRPIPDAAERIATAADAVAALVQAIQSHGLAINVEQVGGKYILKVVIGS